MEQLNLDVVVEVVVEDAAASPEGAVEVVVVVVVVLVSVFFSFTSGLGAGVFPLLFGIGLSGCVGGFWVVFTVFTWPCWGERTAL